MDTSNRIQKILDLLTNGVITTNQAREMCGLAAISNGEVFLVPLEEVQ